MRNLTVVLAIGVLAGVGAPEARGDSKKIVKVTITRQAMSRVPSAHSARWGRDERPGTMPGAHVEAEVRGRWRWARLVVESVAGGRVRRFGPTSVPRSGRRPRLELDFPYHAFKRGDVVRLVAQLKNVFHWETEYRGPLLVVP